MVTTRGAPRAGRTRPGLKPILHTSPPLPGLAPPPHLRARTKGEEHLQPACRMIETPPRLALGRGLHAYAHNTPLHRAPNAGTEGQRATTRLLSTPLHRAPNSGTEGPRGITRHQAGRGTTTVTSPPLLPLPILRRLRSNIFPPSYWARTYHYWKARAAGLCRGVDTAGHCVAGPHRHITTPTATWSPIDQRQTTSWGDNVTPP